MTEPEPAPNRFLISSPTPPSPGRGALQVWPVGAMYSLGRPGLSQPTPTARGPGPQARPFPSGCPLTPYSWKPTRRPGQPKVREAGWKSGARSPPRSRKSSRTSRRLSPSGHAPQATPPPPHPLGPSPCCLAPSYWWKKLRTSGACALRAARKSVRRP